MELSIIIAVAVAIVLVVGAVYLFMKNKTSVDPTSYKDEMSDLKHYIDARLASTEQKIKSTLGLDKKD